MSEEVESSIVDKNLEKYNKLVDKAVPIRKEIKDINKDIHVGINKCVKNAYDRPSAEFNFVRDILLDNEHAEGETKMYKLLNRVRAIVEYCSLMGNEQEYKQYCSDLGISLSLSAPVEDTLGQGGFNKETKFRNEWAELFSAEPGDDKAEIMKELMRLSKETKLKVDELNEVIKVDIGDELKETGISTSTLNKGINLKIRAEHKDDVEDKVNSITEESLLQAEALRSII